MKKRIDNCTFKEFIDWANQRACDGGWDMRTAMVCIKAINEVLDVKPIFRRKKAREKKWEEIRKIYFNPDAEIDI